MLCPCMHKHCVNMLKLPVIKVTCSKPHGWGWWNTADSALLKDSSRIPLGGARNVLIALAIL